MRLYDMKWQKCKKIGHGTAHVVWQKTTTIALNVELINKHPGARFTNTHQRKIHAFGLNSE